MLNTPEVVKGLIALEAAIERSGLDNGLLTLMRLSVPQANTCALFVQMQVKDALLLAEVMIRSARARSRRIRQAGAGVERAAPTGKSQLDPAGTGTVYRLAIPREPKEDMMIEARKVEALPTGPAEVATLKPAPRKRAQSALIAVALLGTAVGGVYFGYDYWTSGRFLVSTDDAYVKADYTTVAPKISGYIDRVLVEDNQAVKAGQVLARIDDRDFRTARDQARADVDAARASIRNIEAEIDLQHSVIDEAKAAIAADQASLGFASVDAERYRALAKTGAGSLQRAQQSAAANRESVANLDRDRAGLAASEQKIAVLTTQREQALAQLDHIRAVLAQTELNLSYTIIAAPVDGTVGSRSLRVGEYVTAGTQLMAVVPLRGVYVVANFKETQLTHVHDGQPVEVRVDGFPGQEIKAHVDSLSPASGLEFSLLPPDNATGNFTKIVQRIPVKIALDDPQLVGLLRPGMSVEPTIDTKTTAVASRRVAAKPQRSFWTPVSWIAATAFTRAVAKRTSSQEVRP